MKFFVLVLGAIFLSVVIFGLLTLNKSKSVEIKNNLYTSYKVIFWTMVVVVVLVAVVVFAVKHPSLKLF